MRKKITSFLVLLLIIPAVYAQIGNEIKAYIDSTEIIVNNGRKMLEAKIIENDYQKAREIYKYLTDLTSGKNYSAFSYTENLFLNIILNDWEKLTEFMFFYPDKKDTRVYQNAYNIGVSLMKKLQELDNFLFQECNNSDLDEESKRVSTILLHAILKGSDNSEYNEMLNNFRRDYRETRYEVFIKDFLPAGKIKASWSASLGSGGVFATGSLKENFFSSMSAYMGMDLKIKNIYSSFFLKAAWPALKEPFTVITPTDIFDFRVDEKFSYLDVGARAGYIVARSERFHLAPFISASGCTLKSNRFDNTYDEKREYKIFNAFSLNVGLHTEIKIATFKPRYQNIYGANLSYTSFKIEGGYNYLTKFSDNSFKGNIIWLTAALVLGFGDF